MNGSGRAELVVAARTGVKASCMSTSDQIYARLPVWLQHAGVSAFGAYWHWLRFGPGYRQLAEGYRRAEQLSAADLRRVTDARLRQLLAACAEHVPYYREAWTGPEKQAARAGSLADLPILEKDTVRANPRALIRTDLHERRPLVFHTSGSTGTPIATIWSRRDLRDSLALREVRSANWAGVSFSDPRATFSGRMVVPNPHSQGPFHRFNLVERQVYFSAFHLSPKTAPAYLDALRKHKVVWGTGYAVSWGTLARLMLELRLPPPPQLRVIVTTSEKVTPEMRAMMEEAFQCRVFEEYSSVENAVFASECYAGSLHVSLDSGLVEILDDRGNPCPTETIGQVVATCISRTYQPFIRFRLGDLAVWSDKSCACGSPLPVLREVIGRLEDVVVGPDGREMVRFHGIFVDLPSVREGQVVQLEVDHIQLRVVVADGFGGDDEAEMIRRVRERLGAVRVSVERLDAIPRDKSGKFRAVVSLIKPT